ncbi:hypothetical protein ACFSUD_02410 [Sulfitobacter aestuarii]|uniref:Uncharacterized protein n=1 Tax=Sulfitobacter aestuarii TaxID=2161676 RepID=A0ABW5TZ42_9RHOB
MSVSADVAWAGKVQDCAHQASVVAAVRQARLERVEERQVEAYLQAGASWPAAYNPAIPLVTPWVYGMKLRDVKANDLAAAWREMCLAQ